MPPQRSDLGIGPRPRPQPAAEAVRARVAHFAIFNPSIPAPSKRRPARPDGDVDLSAGEPEADGLGPGVNGDGAILDSDDIEQAAQIVFYMCPADPAVAWDVKLKQVGLVRGLMAFTSAVAPGEEPWWSVHSNNARMVVFVADTYHFYVSISDGKGWSDRLVADLLRRGYEDFCLLHGSLPPLPSAADIENIRNFYAAFITTLDSYTLARPPAERLHTWVGHLQPAPLPRSAVQGALDVFADDIADQASDPSSAAAESAASDAAPQIGIITQTQTFSCPDKPLERYLRSALVASIPPPLPALKAAHRPERDRRKGGIEDEGRIRKVSLGWAWPFGSRPGTPSAPTESSSGAARRRGSTGLSPAPIEGLGTKQAREGESGSRRSSLASDPSLPVHAASSSKEGGAVSDKGTEEGMTAWLGLGGVTSAVGGAVGSMGTMFGLRSGDTPAQPASTLRAHQLFPETAHATALTYDIAKGDSGSFAQDTDAATRTPAEAAAEPAGSKDPDHAEALPATTGPAPVLEADSASVRSILEPNVEISELADAQKEQQPLAAKVVWESRNMCVRAEGEEGREKRIVRWTIRDGILLFLIHPLATTFSSSATPDADSNELEVPIIPDAPVLSLFNKLPSILSPSPGPHASASPGAGMKDPASSSSSFAPSGTRYTSLRRNHSPASAPTPRHAGEDAAIWCMADGDGYVLGREEEMRAGVFADFRDTLIRHPTIDEVYGRTSAPTLPKSATSTPSSAASNQGAAPQGSIFAGVSRANGGDETYLAVGKVDASLVDAETALGLTHCPEEEKEKEEGSKLI